MVFKFNWKKFDGCISRSSHIAQIILVGFAIFGYFYTVRPVFQNQLLSEQIAQKEIDLNNLSKNYSNLSKSYSDLESKKNQMENEISKNEEKINEYTESLKKLYIQNFVERINFVANSEMNKNVSEWNIKRLLENYKKNLFNILINAIDSSFNYDLNIKKNKVLDSTVQKMRLDIRKIVQKNKPTLFNSFYSQKIDSLETTLEQSESDLNKYELERDQLNDKINSEENPHKKEILISRLSDTNASIRDISSVIHFTIIEIRNELTSLLDKGIKRFKILLFDHLFYYKSN
jgi:hypothetical protein